jgi:asparagine synthase (glutamine-hydrolysing)
LLPVSFDNISFDFKVRRFTSGHGVPMEVRHHRWLGSFCDDEKRQLFQPWMMLDELDTYDIARKHVKHCDAHEAINQLLYCDLKLYLEGNMLVKVDRASMASSLEVRVPLLNPILFDFITELPMNLKLSYLKTKYILKKSMAGILPPKIINRGKKGFNIPVAKWICGDLKELIMDTFNPEHIKRQGLFNSQYIQKLLNDHIAGKTDHRKLLWTLLVFELWYDKYFKKA